MTEPRPSDRLVDRRLRNRVMETLVPLADGVDGVRRHGYADWFNDFYSVIDDDLPWDWRGNTAFTQDEVESLDAVLQLMNAALADTPRVTTDDVIVASGWPERIQPVAVVALARMEARGKFSEDSEKSDPDQDA